MTNWSGHKTEVLQEHLNYVGQVFDQLEKQEVSYDSDELEILEETTTDAVEIIQELREREIL
jgi:hypothetical protein